MKILCVSDEVLRSHYSPNVKQNFPEIDLLLGCGDLPYYYLDFLVSAFDKTLYYVRGNHDAGKQYSELGELDGVRGGTNIHGQCINHRGLLIAGLEGSLKYKPSGSIMFTQRQMAFEIAKLMPQLMMNKMRYGRYLDVLITHAPPFGIHDDDDLPHTGFKPFLPFMRQFKPKYLLHGHIHRYRTDIPCLTQYHDTTIMNIYPSSTLDIEVGLSK